MNYYIARNGQPCGPFSVDQLLNEGIIPDSLVWNESMPQWKRAAEIPEIANVLFPTQQQQQPFNQPYQQPYSSEMLPCPKTWLLESILVTIFCCLPFGIVGIVKASNVSSAYSRGDYNGALQSSREAGKWTKLGFFIALVFTVLYFLFCAILGVSMFGLASID